MHVYVLGSLPLAATAADTDAVDNVTLLGLVPKTTGLVGARGTAGAVDDLQLAKLSMHSQLMFNEYTDRDRCLWKCDSYLPALSQR